MTTTLPDNLTLAVNKTPPSCDEPKRTAGEKWFFYLKYVFVGFLANIGMSYLIGRDNLIYQENVGVYSRNVGKPVEQHEKPVGKTFLPDAFHKFNERLRMRMIAPISGFIHNIPNNMRVKPASELYPEEDLTPENIKGLDSIKLADHASQTILNGILLAWGGTIVSAVMYGMEKNRLSLVKKLDKLHDKISPAIDRFFHVPFHTSPQLDQEKACRAAAYERIKKEAKHTHESFAAILGTRALALCAAVGTTATAMYIDPKREGMGRIERGILSGLDKLGNKYNFKLPFMDGDPDNDSPEERLFSLAFLETIVGGFSSLADYMRNRTVQKNIEADAKASLKNTQTKDPDPHIIDYARVASNFRSQHSSRMSEGHLGLLALSNETPALANAAGGF